MLKVAGVILCTCTHKNQLDNKMVVKSRLQPVIFCKKEKEGLNYARTESRLTD